MDLVVEAKELIESNSFLYDILRFAVLQLIDNIFPLFNLCPLKLWNTNDSSNLTWKKIYNSFMPNVELIKMTKLSKIMFSCDTMMINNIYAINIAFYQKSQNDFNLPSLICY